MSSLLLRRSDMLKLVDMPARPFDAMLAREQTPWSRRDTGRSWGQFSTEDAYRVALVHALVRQGRSYETASRTIRAEFEDLINLKRDEPGEVLFGSFITETEPSEEDGVRMHLSFAAPQSVWFEELSRVKNLVAADDTLIAFSAVNATAVMKRTLIKAQAADLVDDQLTAIAARVRAL